MSDRPDGFVRLASRDLRRHDRAAMQTSRHAPNGARLVKLLVKLLKFLRFKADVLHAVPSNAPFQAVGLYMPWVHVTT